MNYEEMSDFEINKSVAQAKGIRYEAFESQIWATTRKSKGNVIAVKTVIDFCNNPSDAWPIIVENRITIIYPYSSDPIIEHETMADGYITCENMNASVLKQCMILFLKIKGSNNV